MYAYAYKQSIRVKIKLFNNYTTMWRVSPYGLSSTVMVATAAFMHVRDWKHTTGSVSPTYAGECCEIIARGTDQRKNDNISTIAACRITNEGVFVLRIRSSVIDGSPWSQVSWCLRGALCTSNVAVKTQILRQSLEQKTTGQSLSNALTVMLYRICSSFSSLFSWPTTRRASPCVVQVLKLWSGERNVEKSHDFGISAPNAYQW
jgi:hypothetical protein